MVKTKLIVKGIDDFFKIKTLLKEVHIFLNKQATVPFHMILAVYLYIQSTLFFLSALCLYHPSFLRGEKSKVDELGRFFQGYLGVPLGPQKDQETNTFTKNFFPFSRAEIQTRLPLD